MHGQDEARLLGLGLNFLPQADNVRIHCASCREPVVAPHFLEQTIAAQRFAGMAEEILQQLKLFRGKIKFLAAA